MMLKLRKSLDKNEEQPISPLPHGTAKETAVGGEVRTCPKS